MTLFVLDTDILLLFQEGQEAVCRRVCTHALDELATTVITVEEQLSGWYTLLRRAKGSERLARAYQRLADSVTFLSHFQILSFTEEAIRRYEHLKSLKLGTKKMDLRIAAIALEQGATLVTLRATGQNKVTRSVSEGAATGSFLANASGYDG